MSLLKYHMPKLEAARKAATTCSVVIHKFCFPKSSLSLLFLAISLYLAASSSVLIIMEVKVVDYANLV